MEVYLKLKKVKFLWMFLVSMTFSHLALAQQYGDLKGVFRGKSFTMKTVTITKKIDSSGWILESATDCH